MQDYFGVEIPFARHIGVTAISKEPGRVRLKIDLEAYHGNNLGIAHGGAILTLLDIALGSAARTTVGVPVMTIDIQASFLAPGKGTLYAEGRVVKQGRSIVFCEGDVKDENGELLAKASGVFKPVKPRGGIMEGGDG